MKKENIPNALTLIRVVMIPIFIAILSLSHSYLGHIVAAVIFAIASITDYLDGFLARKWNVVSNFGKFADPMADKLLVMSAFIMMIELKMVPAWIAAVIICRELAVTGLRLLLVETGGTVLAAAMPGKIKTFSQMFAIIFLLCHWTLPGQVLLYIALIFTIYSGYDYFKGSSYLFKDTFQEMKQIMELKNVSFRYDKTVEEYQIDTVSFHVKQGEWLSIVGHNGSGKSTVVRLIDGLLEAESGEIYIDGKKLTRETIWEIRSKIGIVFQNPDNQFVGATVEDDVAFGLENQGIPRGEMLQRVEKAIDQVGMLKFKDREPSRLSGGQKQRVAIAGIIALRPTIIILDEATSMLDPEGREDLMAVMRELQKKFQLTIISITHDLSEIALSDRTLVFQKGKLESSMTPRELFSRNDLNEIGLDKPFSKQVQESLSSHFPLKQDYLTESELLDQLWEFL